LIETPSSHRTMLSLKAGLLYCFDLEDHTQAPIDHPTNIQRWGHCRIWGSVEVNSKKTGFHNL
jgi:hypothetical protein